MVLILNINVTKYKQIQRNSSLLLLWIGICQALKLLSLEVLLDWINSVNISILFYTVDKLKKLVYIEDFNSA